MTDTHPEYNKKQIGIMMAMTSSERALYGIDMIDSVYKIVQKSILLKNSDISERDLIAEVFKRYYQNDFDEQEIEKIYQHLKNIEKS